MRPSIVKRAFTACLVSCAIVFSTPVCATADKFPAGPVRFIVPVPAGGVTDAMARIVGQHLSDIWGQPVIVENRPGGNYSVAAQAVARAPADGYTLLVAPDSTFTANPFLFSNLTYKTSEFTPIIVLSRATPMLVVNASLGVNSVPELIALAKSKPGTLNYGSYGNGTYAHLSMEDFKQRTGTQIVHIPYRGAAPAATGLLGGEVSMLLLNLSSIEAHESGGKVKILASAGDKRAAKRPDLPTVAESGLPGFSTSIWFALLGPANMPPELVKKIHADVTRALNTPEAVRFFDKNSFERVDLSPAEFGQLIERDSRHWQALIKSVGVKAQ
ncbi:MAG: Bug family tripartite tricarboxylate transporter substrate binding protein [Pseudorhodoplanes sp.]|uniref:Bug family tripartite tricarboxylate transporter substrate binding protein n=1 Tax=Pseudorhodoplanes sp. TaxID=1934341 RepID=UPI003D118DF9